MPDLPSPVAIAGAGTMGAGLAAVFAAAGCEVRLIARREATLGAAAGRLASAATSLGADPRTVASRVSGTVEVHAGAEAAQLVIETITEDLEAKRALLPVLEDGAAPDAVVVTNTSSLPLAELAPALRRPERFAGFHWFNPPEVVELVEVVGGPRTGPQTLEVLAGWARALGKMPIVVRRDVPGFVANRLQYGLLREAWALVEEGVCELEDVDRALTHGLGPRWAAVGPFQTADLAGLDVHLAVARNLFPALRSDARVPAALERAVAAGDLGCKTGRGLLGAYGPGAVERIAAARDRMLRAIRRERDGEPR